MQKAKNSSFFSLFLLAWLAAFGLFGCQNRGAEQPKNGSKKTRIEASGQSDAAQKPSKNSAKGIPEHALETLDFIKKNGEAPPDFVGGRAFQNREKRLPKTAPDGQKIQYREWDVWPKERGKNRGAERLVTGSDGSSWYTPDHYKTFKKIE